MDHIYMIFYFYLVFFSLFLFYIQSSHFIWFVFSNFSISFFF